MKLGDLMNPEQYALDVLDMFLHKQCDLERIKFAYNQTEVWNAVKMARDALEKQIPKKIENWNGQASCPCCQRLFGSMDTLKTLRTWDMPQCWCGQRLDWSEEV